MDIWAVLEYTSYVTVIGLLIWLIKLMFHDKLDARWHYFIWLVLLVRIVVPVGRCPVPTPLSVFQEIPVGRWMEMGRILAEEKGYSGLFGLFGRIYLWGAVLLGGVYLAMWVVLRIQVASAPKADEAARAYVDEIAGKYHLKSCSDIRIRRSRTPYICGILHPVLVLPRGKWPEEPVIVHELLHRKHRDVLVNVGVHAVRVVNWFNPVIWFLTAEVLNDSEALCDQRVLEHCGKDSAREYGELLIAIGEGKGGSPVKIGTSNMASSYRNMKTRICRIRDFCTVPGKVGLVTLCITLMLAVAGIGSEAEEAYGFKRFPIVSARKLEKALLYARCYHAHTPEEAVYLFLRACEESDLAYRLSVLPQEEIPRYQEFAGECFEAGRDAVCSEVLVTEGYPAYFPREALSVGDFRIYNLSYDETAGSATVCVIPNGKWGQEYAIWELELEKQDGWKVWLAGESEMLTGEYNPESMLSGTAQLGDFLVELSCYNEGRFQQLGAARAGVALYGSGEEGKEDFPQFFSMEYKHRCVTVAYLGEEPLDGREIRIVTAGEEPMDLTQQRAWKMAGSPEGENIEEVAESYGYSDNQGNGTAVFDGRELTGGIPRLVYGMGEGASEGGLGWKIDDELSAHIWIYIDQELAVEGEVHGKWRYTADRQDLQ